MGCVPSYPVPLTTLAWSHLSSTPLNSPWLHLQPPGLITQPSAFISPPCSLLTFLRHCWDVWKLPGMVISPHSSSSSSPGLPGEFASSLGLEHSCSHSDVSCSFLSMLLVSLTCLDNANMSITLLVGLSLQLTQLLLFPLSLTLRGFSCCLVGSSGLVSGGGGSGGVLGASSSSAKVC